MNELPIKKENVLQAHKSAGKDGKKLLEELFGPEVFKPMIITDRVKSFEDACQVLGFNDHDILPHHDGTPVPEEINTNAYVRLKTIARALNEGWQPDWTNSNEYKWYPYFEYKAGFGFSYTDYVHWSTDAVVGSRLCYKTKELAMYAGTQFQSIYNEYLTIN